MRKLALNLYCELQPGWIKLVATHLGYSPIEILWVVALRLQQKLFFELKLGRVCWNWVEVYNNSDQWQYLNAKIVTVFFSYLRRERERTVNAVLQTFQTVDHVQHESFQTPNVPYRSSFLKTVLKRSEKVMQTVRYGQERN